MIGWSMPSRKIRVVITVKPVNLTQKQLLPETTYNSQQIDVGPGDWWSTAIVEDMGVITVCTEVRNDIQRTPLFDGDQLFVTHCPWS